MHVEIYNDYNNSDSQKLDDRDIAAAGNRWPAADKLRLAGLVHETRLTSERQICWQYASDNIVIVNRTEKLWVSDAWLIHS